MKIVVANPTGLCFGVRRAISALEEELRRHKKVYSLGSPIHNPQEIARLEQKGLVVAEDVSETPEGAVSFVRAHGVTPAVYEELLKKSSKVIDGTCPFVKTAQERAKKLSQEGYVVVISGDAAHPEVQGIVGCLSGSACAVARGEEIPERALGKRCGILSQTTQRVEVFQKLVAEFAASSSEIKVYNTICRATIERQQSTRELARHVDGIIVLGGKNSANTKKLAEIGEASGVPTLWIEHAGELKGEWTLKKNVIGIAAGSSTPDWLINELIKKLKTM